MSKFVSFLFVPKPRPIKTSIKKSSDDLSRLLANYCDKSPNLFR